MNVYDFDETVYHGDCTRDFVIYLLFRQPSLWRYWPRTGLAFIRYQRGDMTRTEFKETLYRMFCEVDNIEETVTTFWRTRLPMVKDYYRRQMHSDDVIISASPRFILEPCCRALGIKHLLASEVDPKTGCYQGPNCWGNEKVRRYLEAGFQIKDMERFYSDSYVDTPLAVRAQEAFFVQGEKVMPWNEAKPQLWRRLYCTWKRRLARYL